MDERQRTLAALTVIFGFLMLIIIIIGSYFSSRRVISPVPEDPAFKIIFLTPTPAPEVTVTEKETPDTDINSSL